MAARPQSRAGDVTGREREKQQAEHAREIKAGAERLTTTNPPPRMDPDPTQIEDLTGAGGVRMLTLEEIEAEGLTTIPQSVTPDSIDADSLDDGRVTPGLVDQKPTRPEEPQPVRPGAEEIVAGSALPGGAQHGGKGTTKAAQVVESVQAENPYRILRVREDLEEVTIGKGNTFTFLEGKYYRVTPEVYDHLEEKGFVYH